MKPQYIIFVLLVIFLSSCKKDTVTKQYIVKGQLLESSSNQIPVPYFTLTVFQSSTYSILTGGYIGGISKKIQTNGNGYFEFNYESGGVLFFNDNYNPLSLQGRDPAKYGNMLFLWSPVSSNVDTNLNNLFLYKKINTLIRKVYFFKALQAGDSLEISSKEQTNTPIAKLIRGPILIGSIIHLDTSYNFLFSNYNIKTSDYSFITTLRNKNSYRDTIIQITKTDEISKELIFIYQ